MDHTLPVSWTLPDMIALSRVGRMDAHDRISLIAQHSSLDSALQAVGALDLDLQSEANRICDDASRQQLRIITWFDSDYPPALRTVPDPPLLLYVRGHLPEPATSIAVVGTRSCTASYGKPVTDRLVSEWVAAGCAIVSGLAVGIDTCAHEACLRGGGQTVAVIASGAGRISPKAARYLADRIVDHGGAVVSEYPWHVAALPPYFPARNRIIVGLSAAVVVIESKHHGGALITARIARSSQRPLWCVPGPITSTRSEGTNRLLATGDALHCLGANDILRTLPVDSLEHSDRPLPADVAPLMEAMHQTLSVDLLAEAWGCSTAEAHGRLLLLELDGIVEQVPGSQYRLR